jgi:hypothetical protein
LQIPQLVLKAWKRLTVPLELNDQAAGIADLAICPVTVLTYVAGTHLVGDLSGTPISQDYRDRAPTSCKLLKAAGLADTLNFGSITWTSQASDDRFQQFLKSFYLGETAMRTSESSIHVALTKSVEFLWNESLAFAYPGGTSAATPALGDADTTPPPPAS